MLLAAHPGSPQTRQRIAGLFWPESADGQALTNLRRELHNLRQIIGDDPALVVTARDLCWRDSPTCRVDLMVFESEWRAALAAADAGDTAALLAHAGAAVGQYRGEFLPGSYDSWLLEVRSELEQQCAGLCDLLTEARAGTGDLTGAVASARIPPAPPFPQELWGRKACGIVWCYTGAHDRASEVLAPVKSFGSPLLAGLHEMPFTVLQSAFDALYPAGLQWYWRSDFFSEISDTAIGVHIRYGAQLPTGHSTMHLYPIDGAVSRVATGATAFAYRDGGWAGVIVGVDPDPASAERISAWARDYWEELHPTSAGGAYVNFLMAEGSDRVKAAYRGNFERLSRIKNRYDPDNVFHINQNIVPATALA